jgi:hypothetical protein
MARRPSREGRRGVNVKTKIEFAPKGVWYDVSPQAIEIVLTDDDNAPFTTKSQAAVTLVMTEQSLRELYDVVKEALTFVAVANATKDGGPR